MRNPNAPVPGIVEQAVDLKKLATEARKLNIAIRDGEALVERTTENLAERRERLGKLLVEAREGFSTRGDGFVEWVEKEIGIPFPTARDYMKGVGYVPAKKAGAGGSKSSQDDDHDGSRHDSERDDSDTPPSNIVRLIHEGVTPQEAALLVSKDSALDWMDELERLVESMRKAARSLFSSAEALDALCRQHEASVSSPAALTMHSMLVAAKTSIQKTLRLMGKDEQP